MHYNDARKKFEPAWQKYWEKKKIYQAKGKGKKWYSLIEFPYPSGDGLHVGHVRSNTAMDIISRKRRMEGYDVLFPIGWDAFGLPTENYAIKTGISPEEATKKNTDNFRRQLKELGFSFDWSREVNTTDPSYYKWTQWMFLQFFKHGLAYKAKSYINWCPKDKIGLANEEAAGGVCDRCGGPVEKREKEQWMLRITKYADRLLDGLKGVDYINQAKVQQENWIGKEGNTYKLHDWVFSRQRYWGEPIPLINCGKCGWVPVPEKELPLKLPKVEKYQPTDTGESPLSKVDKWVNVKCPTCKGPAKRETDTMPNWAGSSWYFLRYTDPTNKKAFADPKKLKYFTPVDWYNGGMEHTVLHLLYSRFWNMFLHDIGLVPTAEPYKKRTSHGLILGASGEKMSKSRGNVINPDTIIKEFGADSLRLYEMFIGPFDQAVTWDERGILGTHRFLERVWTIGTETTFSHSQESENVVLGKAINKLIKKIGEDVEAMSFNTAVSAMMIFTNEISNTQSPITKETWEKFLLLLSPFAPHIAEELWSKLGHKKSIALEPWPTYDKKLVVDAEFELVIQVNGKIRDKVNAPMGISQGEAEKLALGREEVKKWVSGAPKKVIYVENRLINFIV